MTVNADYSGAAPDLSGVGVRYWSSSLRAMMAGTGTGQKQLYK